MKQSTYDAFLESKRLRVEPCGFDVPDADLNPALFDFQRAITRWALRRGRAAIFADCGLGKTPMQLEWARHVAEKTGKPVLILAPLAVSQQTQREGKKFGILVNYCRSQGTATPGVNITNYEMLEHFQPGAWGGIVLDESSILKAFGGVTRQQITEFAKPIQYRLACTATPAPNDLIELCNHAEFLNVMTGKEIIALFFKQDGNTTHAWRLKGHAQTAFWKWMAEWSVAIRRPSDLGYPDDKFVLPALEIEDVTLTETKIQAGYLIPLDAVTLQERRAARKQSLEPRVEAAAELANGNRDPWVIWCNLNAESDALAQAIPDAVAVSGSDSLEEKEAAVIGFSRGEIRVLVTKPTICGFGMNWQHCAHVAFVGLSDSYEQFYQAIRRCWRFGQKRRVKCYVITANTEGAVVANIKRKERQAAELMDGIVQHMKGLQCGQQERDEAAYTPATASGRDWTLHLGDCVERTAEVKSGSVGLTVFSPPFPGMYAYSNSPRDLGNSDQIAEMMRHFEFLVPELLRVTAPGRMCCIHLMQLTAMQTRDGYIGVKDYRGAVIQCMESGGWVYAGEVTIDKNPQVQATRNKERGLLFKTLATDSSLMRMALADYVIYFRKPGKNTAPIRAGVSSKYNDGGGWISEEEWIEWAAPVWYRHQKGMPGGIRETDVLNVACARESEDERHLCPLQLGVIERCVKLWSAPGETVFSPFAGIGSEGYVALKFGRKFIGIELKESYWKQAQRYLKSAQREKRDILSLIDAGESA